MSLKGNLTRLRRFRRSCLENHYVIPGLGLSDLPEVLGLPLEQREDDGPAVRLEGSGHLRPILAVYRHFKGGLVWVVDFEARLEADMTCAVAYFHDDRLFIRPFTEFFSKVRPPGSSRQVRRFAPVFLAGELSDVHMRELASRRGRRGDRQKEEGGGD